MTRALERQAAGQADVVPVILHSCEWLQTPLGKFNGVPADGKPIAKASYPEDAYLEVARAVRRVMAARQKPAVAAPGLVGPGMQPATPVASRAATAPSHPRSSNLAIRKTITDADRHAFLEDGFEFMARFFEESLAELGLRNPGVEARFRRNGADVFTARAYRGGKLEAECRVQLGGMISGNSISFSYDANASAGSSNEMLSVKEDDQGLMFDALGLSVMSGREHKGLSQGVPHQPDRRWFRPEPGEPREEHCLSAAMRDCDVRSDVRCGSRMRSRTQSRTQTR